LWPIQSAASFRRHKPVALAGADTHVRCGNGVTDGTRDELAGRFPESIGKRHGKTDAGFESVGITGTVAVAVLISEDARKSDAAIAGRAESDGGCGGAPAVERTLFTAALSGGYPAGSAAAAQRQRSGHRRSLVPCGIGARRSFDGVIVFGARRAERVLHEL